MGSKRSKVPVVPIVQSLCTVQVVSDGLHVKRLTGDVQFRELSNRRKVQIAEVREGSTAICLGLAHGGWEVSQSRALVGYVLIRWLGYKLKDVAKCLGRDVATVSSLVSHFAACMSENETLRKQAARLAADCQE
jgi:hypothetical protein